MAAKRGTGAGGRQDQDLPKEITMTDLEAAGELPGEGEPGEAGGGVNMSGTPGGGTASGGLGGTNIGDGSPDGTDLEDAMGAGIYDTGGEEETEDDAPLSGASGGAVGGTPARGRAKGSNVHRGIAPGGVHRGDSTIGADPSEERK